MKNRSGYQQLGDIINIEKINGVPLFLGENDRAHGFIVVGYIRNTQNGGFEQSNDFITSNEDFLKLIEKAKNPNYCISKMYSLECQKLSDSLTDHLRSRLEDACMVMEGQEVGLGEEQDLSEKIKVETKRSQSLNSDWLPKY